MATSTKIVTVEDIKNILTSPDMDLTKKIDTLAKSDGELVKFVNVMVEYNDKMKIETKNIDPNEGANQNYRLYTRLMKICRTNQYEEFKILFDVVNYIFYLYREEGYKDVYLHRFDINWTWGSKKLKTYQNLVTMLSVLCDRATRKNYINSISLNKVLDLDKTEFTEVAVNNIRRYYTE